MWEWLTSPIDPGRAHLVDFAISWHARSMVLAWGILAPLAVFAARFLKILPGQNWPQELDSQVWWRSHWIGQIAVVVLSLGGLALVLPADLSQLHLHQVLGYAVLLGMGVQVLFGLLRGTKGGPTAPAADGSWRGDHYDMTRRRLVFEAVHKAIGYLTLILAVMTILSGLWTANGPIWMWITLIAWWALLVGLFIALQSRGLAVDTYQAIWGDDPTHPGNRRAAQGWGARRPVEYDEGDANVRGDRGDRIRSH